MGFSVWKKVELGNFIEIKHGYAYKGKNFSSEETNRILLTPGNFNIGGGFKSDKFKYYSEDAENPIEYVLKPNDLLITMTDLSKSGDTLGFPVFIPKLENKIILHNQRTGKVIIKSSEVDIAFIYYLFCTREYRHHVLSTATGTTVRHTAPKRIESYKFKLPSINEQRNISSILSTLDEKIQVNNQINKKLEEMAQSIFKYWFVDFEFPNEDGEPYKSSDGEMVESELGMIPKGWKVKTINELKIVITDYVANGSFKSLKENVKLYEDENYALFMRNTDLKCNFQSDKKYVDEHSYNFLSKTKLFGGEVIISNVGDVGSVYLCPYFDVPMTLGNNVIMLNSNDQINLNIFLYRLFKSREGQGMIDSITGGSAQPKFNKTDFRNLKLIVPENNIIERMNMKIGVIEKNIIYNMKQNSKLSALRDALLPKLMSGEIRVPLDN